MMIYTMEIHPANVHWTDADGNYPDTPTYEEELIAWAENVCTNIDFKFEEEEENQNE